VLSFPASVRIHVALGATDMRKSFDGLSGVVTDVLGEDPLSGHVFAFCNRRRTILKLLVWDRSGFFLFAKRLEQGTYAWPDDASDRSSLVVTTRELTLILEGIDVRDARLRKRFERVRA
jgi:transposase